MEPKFCGKCGQPMSECTCAKAAPFGRTRFPTERSPFETTRHSGSYYVDKLDNLSLCDGEEIVRQYNIGRMNSMVGRGEAYMIVTNRRVISKSDSNYLGMTTNSVDEIAIESVVGTSTYFAKGFSIWRIIVGVWALVIAFVCFSHISWPTLLLGFMALGVLVWMALTCRKPSYLFGVYASTTARALESGVNLRGKILSSHGNGLVFQFKPTEEALEMMREIGACIMDLKAKGDYAISAWKRA